MLIAGIVIYFVWKAGTAVSNAGKQLVTTGEKGAAGALLGGVWALFPSWFGDSSSSSGVLQDSGGSGYE